MPSGALCNLNVHAFQRCIEFWETSACAYILKNDFIGIVTLSKRVLELIGFDFDVCGETSNSLFMQRLYLMRNYIDEYILY